ncbi:DNA mismatch repair protein [Phlyctochytrium bullatum]|nr:DNA mismatch repair protein [Phlyctochytrium bullatum]
MEGPRARIVKLDEAVINRIAAGEVIQRPANAVKELIENSLDAGSTSITVMAKDGGLKLLQIQDNGHGILKDDLPLVCERFATSKLKHFDDLLSIGTYGFRGEALASISHVAHVTITTKTADSPCAWRYDSAHPTHDICRAQYMDGKLWDSKTNSPAEPKPTAGNNGTQITIEDLFFNVETRKKAFKSFSDEYNRILDVLNKYAIHNSRVGTNTADLRTQQGASAVDNVRLIYGANIAKELLELNAKDDALEVAAKGLISNANYNVKKMTFILFINGRLVESSALKKMFEAVYQAFLPKNTHPFIYLSLEIKPYTLDVNVHPTKKEVLFLHEDQIVEFVANAARERLAGANESRTFVTQNVNMAKTTVITPIVNPKSTPAQSKKVAEHKMVRTDSQSQTLHPFLTKTPPEKSAGVPRSATEILPREDMVVGKQPREERPQQPSEAEIDEIEEDNSILTRAVFTEVRLNSVLELRVEYEEDSHKGSILANIADFFYQLYLKGFSNYGYIRLSNPLPIQELIQLALEHAKKVQADAKHLDPIELAEEYTDLLMSKREMLLEYFSIEINEEGNLLSLPVLLKNYSPKLGKLPDFLARLAAQVEWDDEKECFLTLGKEIAYFYACESPKLDQCYEVPDCKHAECVAYRNQVEHVVLKGIRQWFLAPRDLVKRQAVIQIADLPELYKVFERVLSAMSHIIHADHILVAEFDIDRGAQLTLQYPFETGTDPQSKLILDVHGYHFKNGEWQTIAAKPRVSLVLDKGEIQVWNGILSQKHYEIDSEEVIGELYNSINSLDISLMPRLTLAERSILRASEDRNMFDEKFLEMEEKAFYKTSGGGARLSGSMASISSVNKDRHFFETKIEFDNVKMPMRIPLAVLPEEIGDFSVIQLVTTFSGLNSVLPAPDSNAPLKWKNGAPYFWHFHLDSGPSTHPIIILMNALLTQKRIVFLGHQKAAGDVANYVLSACAIASGGGAILKGFAERCFPYVSLAGVENLLQVPGFIAGVTNPVFEEQTSWWDVLCNVNTGRITVSSRIEVKDRGVISEDKDYSKDRSRDWMKTGSWEGDNDFISEIAFAIQAHMGELYVRQKFYDFVRRFIEVTAAYELESIGTTGIGMTPINTVNSELGVGAYFSDEASKRKEMLMLRNRMEGWRSTKSYLFYQKVNYLRRRPVKEIDLRHIAARLRASSSLEESTVVQLFLALEDHLVKQSDAALLELLSLLPQNMGGLMPIATASERDAYLEDPAFAETLKKIMARKDQDSEKLKVEQRLENRRNTIRMSIMFEAKNAGRINFKTNSILQGAPMPRTPPPASPIPGNASPVMKASIPGSSSPMLRAPSPLSQVNSVPAPTSSPIPAKTSPIMKPASLPGSSSPPKTANPIASAQAPKAEVTQQTDGRPLKAAQKTYNPSPLANSTTFETLTREQKSAASSLSRTNTLRKLDDFMAELEAVGKGNSWDNGLDQGVSKQNPAQPISKEAIRQSPEPQKPEDVKERLKRQHQSYFPESEGDAVSSFYFKDEGSQRDRKPDPQPTFAPAQSSQDGVLEVTAITSGSVTLWILFVSVGILYSNRATADFKYQFFAKRDERFKHEEFLTHAITSNSTVILPIKQHFQQFSEWFFLADENVDASATIIPWSASINFPS